MNPLHRILTAVSMTTLTLMLGGCSAEALNEEESSEAALTDAQPKVEPGTFDLYVQPGTDPLFTALLRLEITADGRLTMLPVSRRIGDSEPGRTYSNVTVEAGACGSAKITATLVEENTEWRIAVSDLRTSQCRPLASIVVEETKKRLGEPPRIDVWPIAPAVYYGYPR